MDYPNSRFLNVDLDMRSKMPLDELVSAFGAGVIVLHVGKWGRRYGARLELSRSGNQDNAERLVRRFIGLVRALPRSKRKLWRGALSREFNIGIQASAESQPFEFRLEPETLRAVAAVNGRLGVTVYAPDRQDMKDARGRRKKIRGARTWS